MYRGLCCGWRQWHSLPTQHYPFQSTPSRIEGNESNYVLQQVDTLHLSHVAKELEEDRFDSGIGIIKAGDDEKNMVSPHNVKLSTGHVPGDLRVLQRVETMHNLSVVIFGKVANGGAGIIVHRIHVVGSGKANMHCVFAKLHSIHNEGFGSLCGMRKLDQRF